MKHVARNPHYVFVTKEEPMNHVSCACGSESLNDKADASLIWQEDCKAVFHTVTPALQHVSLTCVILEAHLCPMPKANRNMQWQRCTIKVKFSIAIADRWNEAAFHPDKIQLHCCFVSHRI